MSFDLSEYVDVAERIKIAKELYPEISLQPANPSVPYVIEEIQGSTYVIYTAAFYRDPNDLIPGIGCAWEVIPGTTPYTRGSELMVAETSAWGRAIVAVGISSKKIASKEEVVNAQNRVSSYPKESLPRPVVEKNRIPNDPRGQITRNVPPQQPDQWTTEPAWPAGSLGEAANTVSQILGGTLEEEILPGACKHGRMKFWAGKDGNSRWYCPLPKENPDRCPWVKA